MLDVFSRYVVGWQVSTSLRTELALDVQQGQELASPGHRYDKHAVIYRGGIVLAAILLWLHQ